MPDIRTLIRLANQQGHRPVDQSELLSKVRRLAEPLKGKAINLRVSPVAIEFDVFCSPEINPTLIKDAFQSVGEVITCKRLGLPPGPIDSQAIVTESRQLFNEHRFWEVHEVLEDLWKVLKGSEKNLVQGLILAAAALVHAQKDEESVTWPMLQDALKRLEDQPKEYYGWDVGKFRDHFARVLKAKKLDFPTV